ncbi:DNA topoisomerase [Dunaliella salina]|uniref:DNA topoisomerase n=1 Tax=Dunaliella salina TaxID=3046 RepID=A0ABQ7GPC2_DUNSA|nr:DNA topoisomerase [Dunaliella salina]|eukprot:KAF5836440.1 DNA topoisomerase [Dunaliella salina]
MGVTVLMVAEKPSLAGSIAQILSNGKSHYRRGAMDVHEFDGSFKGQMARFKMTSVIGHVYSVDFHSKFNNWDKTDPNELFQAQIVKQESNPKAHVADHLSREAKGVDYLVLWLDCDREGENICFEVMDCTVRNMRPAAAQNPAQHILRARFSAITAPEIRAAMGSLGVPNEAEALSVDARQELDLRVGVAFTRFQTRYFQGKYGNLDASVVSYGPCQTPTLNFCVERHQAIVSFQPEPFWVVRPHVSKASSKLDLEWDRGRLFDQEIATVYATMVREAKRLRVVDVTEKEERRHRPSGLNTVELLKVASAALGIGPAQAMSTAERLYTQGYLSYPRTESSAYPPNSDLTATCALLQRHPLYGDFASSLLAKGTINTPAGGTNAGDHPPITPCASASEAEIGGGDAWRLYDYVVRHFLGTVSPDAVFKKTKACFQAAGEVFYAHGAMAQKPGFTAIMPWRAIQSEPLPKLVEGEYLDIKEVELHQGKTSAPDYLTEAELIGQMEKHGIGTDASIPTHINNIVERNYVKIESGRRVVPTELGITLIRGYQLIDPELCKPQVRAHVEQQIGLVAANKADKSSVVLHTLQQFQAKFLFFVAKIGRADALFEASFSPLSSSGKPLSKCGKCRRFMKLISSRPTRLFW